MVLNSYLLNAWNHNAGWTHVIPVSYMKNSARSVEKVQFLLQFLAPEGRPLPLCEATTQCFKSSKMTQLPLLPQPPHKLFCEAPENTYRVCLGPSMPNSTIRSCTSFQHSLSCPLSCINIILYLPSQDNLLFYPMVIVIAYKSTHLEVPLD